MGPVSFPKQWTGFGVYPRANRRSVNPDLPDARDRGAAHGRCQHAPGTRIHVHVPRQHLRGHRSPGRSADHYPFYRRAGLRPDRVPMKKVERFVADRTMRNW